MKYLVQQISGMKLSTTKISVSVELFVLSFFLVDLKIGNQRSKDNPPTECHRRLGWTANNASTHHFKTPLPLALRVRGSVRVPLMYLIKSTSLDQSSLSGAHTIIVKNAMAMQVSGLDRLVAYKVFSTRLWNSTIFF